MDSGRSASTASGGLIMDATDPNGDQDRVLHEITRHLRHLRFGSIEILVHEGQVVAIERRERTRFNPPARTGGDPR